MFFSRRQWIAGAAVLSAVVSVQRASGDEPQATQAGKRKRRIAVSTYSFWQFRHAAYRDVGRCIDLAADLGFDGVEILHRQMTDESAATLRSLKRRAFLNGLDLCGFSTHQGFLSPDPQVRRRNIEHTVHCIELCYELGIPTMRVNTGTWGTSKNFDELMKNRGIEPPLEGYNDEDGFRWVTESLAECAKAAEKSGVILGLENHWGLGRTPEGVLRVVREVGSPWLQVTMDTGNFLEDPYDKLEMLVPYTVLVQAKTYYGGGLWYTLDLDYARIRQILDKHHFYGYVSLEFEGKEEPLEGIRKSLDLLRKTLA